MWNLPVWTKVFDFVIVEFFQVDHHSEQLFVERLNLVATKVPIFRAYEIWECIGLDCCDLVDSKTKSA